MFTVLCITSAFTEEPFRNCAVRGISRCIPGVLNKEESFENDSFQGNLLECPQYTRPAEFMGLKVPDVLLSGNHAEIAKWRCEKSLEKTKNNRPDLL